MTDAQVVLGRISSGDLLGGRMDLRPELSLEAVAGLAGPFSGNPMRAAAAVLRVANANMERALRVVSVERGHDPGLFTLVAFGGAGALHACDLAEALRIGRILVPRYPGVLSALGMATAPILKDTSAAVMLVIPAANAGARQTAALRRAFAQLEKLARTQLRRERFPSEDAVAERILAMRYQGQSYELPIAISEIDARDAAERFHAAHVARYAHADVSRPVEVVTARIRLSLAAPVPTTRTYGVRRPHGLVQPTTRRVWFGSRVRRTLVFKRESLAPGARIVGPAVLTQMDATAVINPGWKGEVDRAGNLVLERVK